MREKVFAFKQFSVINDKSAMKVGTDGVLTGAWVTVSQEKIKVLDVGSGSGLISLMIAQRAVNANILGIEIDKEACAEAKMNIQRSPWADRIDIINEDFNKYVSSCEAKFDLIVSNPPFFTNGLRAPEKNRATARHDDTLPLSDLITGTSKLLADGGRLAFIYSASEKSRILELADASGLYLLRVTDVYPTPDSEAKRVLLEFSNKKGIVESNNLVIELSRHEYTEDYINLTKEFYLKM